ncbi:MAG TPA: hypothetical protein VKV23_09525 [Acidimicrobiales bacterium]|nr:hypothetical protein [Acidimicrobiales bacterium]
MELSKQTWRGTMKRQCRDLLAGLGRSAREVASSLEAAGVRATARDPEGCAVAVYLRAILGADERVRSLQVSESNVLIRPSPRWRLAVVVPLPQPVREFIAAFDAERFPTLLRRARPPVARQPVA